MGVPLTVLFDVATMIIFLGKYSLLRDPSNQDIVVIVRGGLEG